MPGQEALAADMNQIIDKLNQTTSVYKTGAGSISHVQANNQQIMANTYNTMVSRINACIAKSRYRRRKYYTGSTLSGVNSNIQISIRNMNDTINNVYNDYCCDIDCHCDSNCTCDANCKLIRIWHALATLIVVMQTVQQIVINGVIVIVIAKLIATHLVHVIVTVAMVIALAILMNVVIAIVMVIAMTDEMIVARAMVFVTIVIILMFVVIIM